MDKYSGDDVDDISSFNVSEKAPILGSLKTKHSLVTKQCVFLVFGLIALTSSIAFLMVYSGFDYHTIIVPDPEFEFPPSSMAMGSYKNAGVVSNGGPCAQIGVDILAKGGNAVDAAIAVMVCDGAVCPEYMGIGGGFLLSVYNATTKKVVSIDARETAPAAADETMYLDDPKAGVHGGLAVAIPGALKGYSVLYEKYGGGVSWESLFEATIQLCLKGITISEHLEVRLRDVQRLIKKDPMLRKTFFDRKTGHVKKVGETYVLPKLARTMKIIAKEGASALYNGSLTPKLLHDLNKINGIITAEDLANYKVEIEDAFAIKLKNGYTIHSGPPPGSGIILAYILRVLEGLWPAPSPGLDAHRLVEAFKYGYAERTHLGDHKFVNVSQIFEKVNSDSYIDGIRSQIMDNFTSLDPKYYGADFDMLEDHGTANLVVVDSMGNAVVGTNTINTLFGCGIMSPSTGIILNNEMDDFSTPGVINSFGIPSSPANFIEPGKRPMSSMCPTIFTDKKGDFVLGVGAAGGSKITLATAYVTALKLWQNKTLKEALDKPRIYHQLLPMEVHYEYGTTKVSTKSI
ncbi:Hypothetical protein CINCED_3A025773 [Cinara cedri]|uniref:Nucleophile aminohydrolases, N-terminal,Gamma-glutamyltranspeptidase n=1 Tax=Cinara cedri TaxID=506608 RepID=A0A5E4MUW2_9HEMI|nr:Hypothetical protein CINCED_3A025773 [Cinara cedri]